MTDQVKGAFNRFAEMYSKKDVKGIMSMFADDPDIVAIGLCERQVAVGPAAVRKMFERDMSLSKAAIKLPFDVVSVDSLGLTAWMAANVYPYAVLNNEKNCKRSPGKSDHGLEKNQGPVGAFFSCTFPSPPTAGALLGAIGWQGKKTRVARDANKASAAPFFQFGCNRAGPHAHGIPPFSFQARPALIADKDKA